MNCKVSTPYVDMVHLQYMKSIDLTDYYNNAQEWGFIFCQVCKLNIAMQNVFEHSTTKRHKYNKLLFGIAQGLSSNVDMDFIVLHIDSLQCRYCDSEIINSDREALVIDHIQDVRHCTRRQSYLNQTNAGSSLKPLDTLISYAPNIRKENNAITQTREYLRDVNYKNQINALRNRCHARDYARPREEVLSKGFSLGVEAGTNIRETNDIRQIGFVALEDTATRVRIESEGCFRIVKRSACMCTLCGCKVPNNPHNIDMHVNGKHHKKVLKIVSELPFFITTVKNGTRSCTICLIEIPYVYWRIEEHINSQMHRNETLRLVQSTSENLEDKGVKTSVPEFKVTSKINQSDIIQNARVSRDYGYERREELPKRSTIEANFSCICPFCVLSLAKGMDFVSVHPNCTKNRRAVIRQTGSQECESEGKGRSFTNEDIMLHRFRHIEEQRSKPMQPLRYRYTTDEMTYMRNLRERNNIGSTKYVTVQKEESLCFISLKVFLACFCLSCLWIYHESSQH